ncbi:hypothetical protein [Persicobacter psychrovividus]|uniref:Late embryogenesis abundant protein LEA-2 subgroup domain-containing protein n=1 Tax=Persicobacter psychrovividus TaxID=387638 RepID=A0ABM7VHH6_9BACT|nr:hypothetical protein PEPS_27130 [Persicobacter psychrovividus]
MEFSPAENDMVSMNAQVRLYNPNKNKITLTALNLILELDQSQVGQIDKEYDLPMPPEGEFDIPIEVMVPTKTIQDKVFKGALLNFMGGKPIVGRFTGYAKVKTMGVPIKVPIMIEKEIDLLNL